MASPRVLVPEDSSSRRRRFGAAEGAAWSVLQAAGWLFLLVGGADLALAWYPFAFGRADWEFATVTATLNGLPTLAIGAALLAATALARGQRWLARSVAVLLATLAVLVIAAAVLYATNVPIALRSVPPDYVARLGLKKAIAKTTLQAVLYPTLFIWIAVSAWRRSAIHEEPA